MKEAKIILQGEESIQMKTLALLIQKASAYRSSVHVQIGDKRANAKSLLGLMSLGMTPGSELTLLVDGPDEEEALATLSQWLADPLLEE